VGVCHLYKIPRYKCRKPLKAGAYGYPQYFFDFGSGDYAHFLVLGRTVPHCTPLFEFWARGLSPWAGRTSRVTSDGISRLDVVWWQHLITYVRYLIEWESRSVLPLSAKSNYQNRCTFTRGHYKLFCSGRIQSFTTRGIWGLILFGHSDLRILLVLNY